MVVLTPGPVDGRHDRLQVDGLSVAYARTSPPVIDDVRFGLDNAVAYLLGRNGLGKTTLLHAMAGLINHQGSVTYDGVPPAEDRRRLAVVHDEPAPYGHLDARDNAAMLVGRNAPIAVEMIGRLLGPTSPGRRVRALSRGQRTVVATCIALCACVIRLSRRGLRWARPGHAR